MNVESVGYALGWVENCLRLNLEESSEADKKYAKELYASFMIINQGVTDLMAENALLKQKLQNIMSAASG